MWGEIVHYNFQKVFDDNSRLVLSFYNNETLVCQTGEMPYDQAAQYPERWHESHNPAVRFLTTEQDETSYIRADR